MKLFFVSVLLFAFSFASESTELYTQLFDIATISGYVTKSFDESVVSTKTTNIDKFPVDAIMAGAMLSKVIYNRIQEKKFSPLSEQEFLDVTDKKSAYPLGAILGGIRLAKFIHAHFIEGKNATLETIMLDKSFPWKEVVNAANIGRSLISRISAGQSIPKRFFEKFTSGKPIPASNPLEDSTEQIKDIVNEIKKLDSFKKIVDKISATIVKRKRSIRKSLSDDSLKCTQCKKGCSTLPPSVQPSCYKACEIVCNGEK